MIYWLARGLDILWWIIAFALTYDAIWNAHSRYILGFTLARWMIRGLYVVDLQIRREEEARQHGPHT